MTYCVAISVNDGLVFCSDSRTNAGPDMLFSHSKMHVFNPAPDRMFVVLSAGNLATTQAIIGRLENELEEQVKCNLATCGKMVEVARYVSQVSREEQQHAHTSTAAAAIDTSVSLILGGQIEGAPPAIYMVYAAGNFISDSDSTPFQQIGESKYGKPILDRIVNRQTSLEDAARCAVVSMDSTLKSNATVGPPIEVLIYEKDSFETVHYVRMEEDDAYLLKIRQRWNEALQSAFAKLPRFEWEKRTQGNIRSISQDQNS
jgi:putative proteasome-type protease